MGKQQDNQNRLSQSEDFGGFMNEFQNEIQKGSDRAAAILGATYLETRLEVLLRSYFIENEKAVDPLFGVNAALGTFDARRQLAYVLGLIKQEDSDQLKHIQVVRNKFAHQLHGLSFANESIANNCRELAKPYEGLPLTWSNWDISDPRWAFTIATFNLMMRLNTIIEGIQTSRFPSPRNIT